MVVDQSSVSLFSNFSSPLYIHYLNSYLDSYVGVTCNFVQDEFFDEIFWLSVSLLTDGFNSVGLFTDLSP